ncbi:MAG: PqqD family protein [Oscillospiraceae bacterium]|nr:PqqD family protein [Oscillospiraceae bacterium]
MKLKLEMIKRDIAGETYLVPIGEAAHSYNGLFALTEVAGFIWDRIPDAVSESDLVNAVLEVYEVDRATAEKDIKEFLGKLREMGIME